MLRSVSSRLDQILTEYNQLRSAYRETRFIRSALVDYQSQVPDNDAPLLESSILFFTELRHFLDAISERLHRIQPKIQQLFGVFQQANFKARTERFIRYLLVDSRLINNKVDLPTLIPSLNWRIDKTQLWFFDVNRNLFPTPAQPRTVRVVNELTRQHAFWQAAEPARQQDEAQIWLDQFHTELEIQGDIRLSDYFHRVFNQDWERFDVALRFAYLLIRELICKECCLFLAKEHLYQFRIFL